MEWTAIIVKVSMSFVFSLLIGFNREKKDSPAGIRTHVIVGMSATLIAIMQNLLMHDQGMKETRLLSAVITGVGFLGAGAISSNKMYVKGLASAATVWTVACLGVVTGSGYYGLAIIGFIVIYITLTVLKKYVYPYKEERIELFYENYDLAQKEINTIFIENNIVASSISYSAKEIDGRQILSTIYLVRFQKNQTVATIFKTLYENEYINGVEIHDL